MLKKFNNIIYIFILLLIIVCSTGCEKKEIIQENTGNEVPFYGDSFVQAIEENPNSLAPYSYQSAATGVLVEKMFEPLIKMDYKGDPYCQLAESYNLKKFDNILYIHIKKDRKMSSGELKTLLSKKSGVFGKIKEIKEHTHWTYDPFEYFEIIYEQDVQESEIEKWKNNFDWVEFAFYKYEFSFKLRENVKWHDGVQFTAADVEYSYDIYMRRNGNYSTSNSLYYVDKLEVIDRFNVKFNLLRPNGNVFELFDIKIAPRHKLENAENGWDNEYFRRNPIGTGPYKLKEWKVDEYLLFESYKDYYGDVSHFNSLIYKIIPDKSQQFLMLMNEELDYMGFTFDQFKNYENIPGLSQRFNIHKMPWVTTYLYIGFNHDMEPLNNLNVRKALTLAVNINEIIEGVYFGNARRVTGPFMTSSPAYNKDIPYSEYNPEKAIKILEQEGYKKNSKGIFEKDGKELKLRLGTNATYKEFTLVVKFVAEYWRNIGVKTELSLKNFIDSKKEIRNGDVETFFAGWILRGDEITSMYHSAFKLSKDYNGSNTNRYVNKEVDRLFEKLKYTMDKEERVKMQHRIHELIVKDYTCIFMFADDKINVVHKRIRNVIELPNGEFNPLTEWWVPENLVKYK